jgi:hypothetical protein
MNASHGKKARVAAAAKGRSPPLVSNDTHGPNRTLATLSNTAARPVIAAIRAESSILLAKKSVVNQINLCRLNANSHVI